MSVALNRVIRNLKRSDELILTPKLDKWLMKNDGIKLDPEHVETLRKLLTASEANSLRSGRFGASQRGACLRKQLFDFLGVPSSGTTDPVLQNIFNDGTWRHLRWQMMLLTAGLVTHVEVPYELPELRLKTSFDALNVDEAWGFELKGTYSLSTVQEGIPANHLMQIHTMFLAAPEVEKFVYVAEDKRTQEWREFVVKRDPAITKAVKAELVRLNEAVDKKKLLPMLKECENGKGEVFRRCPYSNSCSGFDYWSEAEAAAQVSPEPIKKRGPRKKKLKG